MPATIRRVAAVSIGCLLFAACGQEGSPEVIASNSTSSVPGATTTTTLPTGTTTVPTTDGSTTTDAATTTVAESTTTTTTTPLTPADLGLRADGIGPLVYGATVPAAIAVLQSVLGAPTEDTSAEYPNEVTPGQFESADNEFAFTQRFERTLCFANGLCATFGGPSTGALGFVGWRYEGSVEPRLTTRVGVTVGSRWSDFEPSIAVSEGGCYTIGYGETEGISLVLQSSGTMFGSFDDAGNYVIGSPDPSEVTVLSMSAGNLPIFLFDDC
jgi:hypothetical protein